MSDLDDCDMHQGDHRSPFLQEKLDKYDDHDFDLDDSNITIEETEDRSDELLLATLEFTNGISEDTTEIKIFAGREIRVGREVDPDYPQFIIADIRVSKRQFRIYSVVYEEADQDDIQPLIYCQDLESTNGTFVNNTCIGRFGCESYAYLLSDGDVIDIHPLWSYYFRQVHKPKLDNDLGSSEDIHYFIDKYDITGRLLGSGQYGKVYLAKETSTSRQMACKIVGLELPLSDLTTSNGNWAEHCRETKEERTRLMREIKVLSLLNHPHIITLRKAFCSTKFVYMFTDLAPAGDLFSYCNSNGGKLPDLEGRVVCRQIALALEYMHQRGIAHRDIKKENVLIMQIYEFGCLVVLTDFGFANHLHPKTRRLMSRVGTERFVAPEVEAVDYSSDGYTLAVDMWSLGALTFDILVGDITFPRDDVLELDDGQFTKYNAELDFTDPLTARARDFIRRLLVQDPPSRMNVQQALKHSWFTKPFSEGAAIRDACERIVKSWKPRAENDIVIEDLPARTLALQRQEANKRLRRKVPDINPYPFIGLDSRLNPRPQSSRELILENLKKKDALFITDPDNRPSSGPKFRARKSSARLKSVHRNNILGPTYQPQIDDGLLFDLEQDSEKENHEDLTSSVSTSIAQDQLQGSFQEGTEYSDTLNFMNSSQHEDDLTANQPCLDQNESLGMNLEGLQGPRAREEAARKIPRYGYAKAYGEAVRNLIPQKYV